MLSFSSLRSHSKVTLPSVDNGWLINSSIVKDPPKSITTRRIDKVGDTQMVEEMIEDNGSRICGTIMKFPRGVNPAAEYTEPIESSSKISNATIRDNSNNPMRIRTDAGYLFRNQYGRGSGGYLARRLMMYNGAFRPPMYTQEQLLPLSRQPRIRTSCVTHPEKIDYRKTCDTPNIDLGRNIKEYVLQPNCEPTFKKIVEHGGIKCDNIDKFVQDKLLTENVSSGMRTRDLTLKENYKCQAVTNLKPTTAYAYTTPCSEKITRDSMLYVMEKPSSFIKDELLQQNVVTNAIYNDKYGMDVDNTNVNKWILEYPRNSLGEPIVCAPRHSGLLPTTEIESKFYLHDDEPKCKDVVSNPSFRKQVLMENQNATNFVKDDVLNTFDVVGMPTLDNVIAYNILDHNNVDLEKYIHEDSLLSHNVNAGMYGSNKISKYIDDTADFANVKVIDNHIHADASTQITSVDKNVYMHSKDTMGKQRNIRQFTTDSRKHSQIDDPQNYKRNVRLQPTIDLSGYSVSNVGYKPQTADKYNNSNTLQVSNKINDGVFKNKLKTIYSERN